MIFFLISLIGAILGGVIAKNRKGRLADILQYAFVYCLIFTLTGLFLALILHRICA